MPILKYPSASTKVYFSEEKYLKWMNNLIRNTSDRLVKKFDSVYHLSDPAGYCILFQKLFPGSINISELKLNSQKRNDWKNNWEKFRNGATSVGWAFDTRSDSIERLVIESYKDKLHDLRWFYEFYHLNATPDLRRESRMALFESDSDSDVSRNSTTSSNSTNS